jgi:hypothetical protein
MQDSWKLLHDRDLGLFIDAVHKMLISAIEDLLMSLFNLVHVILLLSNQRGQT